MDIIGLTHTVTQSQNFAVVLGEMEGKRRLPIVIGGFEAQAIAIATEQMTPHRPLTHDLFKNTLETFNIDLKEVVINNLLDGIFYARLVCLRDGELIEIDSRTSDALALAVRFDCPIYTYEFILDAAGLALDEEEEEMEEEEIEEEEEVPKPSKPKRGRKRKISVPLSDLSVDELNQRLKEVLEKENYEQAAAIRDELERRRS